MSVLSALRWGLMMAAVAAAPAFAAEKLGPEGFPADWKAEDFQVVSGSIPKPAFALGGSGTVVATPSTPPVPVSSAVAMPAPVAAAEPAFSQLDDYGVLDVASGGATPDVWQKATRDAQEERLERGLRVGVNSPVLREAWRRLLLAKAVAPKAEGVSGSVPLWLGERADALEKLGYYEAAWSLWKELPAEAARRDGELAYGWAQAQLLAGEASTACPVAREQASLGSDNRWGVMVAVCQLIADGGPTGLKTSSTTTGASLSLQLVEPLLKTDNPRLLAILRAVQEGTVVPLGNATADALGGVVLANYPAALWPDGPLYLPDTVLRRLAVSKALPDGLRARAAIQLAGATNWPADGKRAWELITAANASSSVPSLTLPAVLPDAVVLARGMEKEEISGSTAGTGPEAAYVKAALRSGDIVAAAKGLPLWVPNPQRPMDGRAHLQAELALAALKGDIDAGLWDRWLAAQPLQSPAAAQAAQRTAAVIEAMGVTVPPSLWQAMSDKAGPVVMAVDPATNRLLAEAVQDKDTVGILATVSRGFGGMGADRVAPELAGASVSALKVAGFGDLSRRLAIEAMLGSEQPFVRTENRGHRRRAAPSGLTLERPAAMMGMPSGLTRGGLRARAHDDIPMPQKPAMVFPTTPVVPKPTAEPVDLMKDSY